MRTDAQISILGNLAGDPVLKQVQSNDVCNFTVAVSVAGKGDSDEGSTNYYVCSAWGRFGKAMFSRIKKGTRVLVYGMLEDCTIKLDDGTERHQLRVDVASMRALSNLRDATPATPDEPADTATADDTL